MRTIANNGSTQILDRRFRAFFGISSRTCARVWKLLVANADEDEDKNVARPVHLLWALFFMKVYNTRSVNGSIANCDEKTFVKWTWVVLEGLSDLCNKYVSKGLK